MEEWGAYSLPETTNYKKGVTHDEVGMTAEGGSAHPHPQDIL